MKVAAIDIGTNSIHMVLAEMGADHTFSVVDREKDMVKLGAGCFAGGALSEEAFAAGLHSLRKMRKLCDRHRVDDLVATATSAVREAGNGGEFLAEVRRQTGIPVEVITGEEEGRLIYLAVRSAIDLSDRKALMIDIGGGSVEAIVGDARDLVFAGSMKLGVQRLRDRFVGLGDPLEKRDRKRIEEHIREEAEPTFREARDLGFEVLVGTSGTILALGMLAQKRTGGRPWESPNNVTVKRSDLAALAHELADLDEAGRARVPGLDSKRADTIHFGAILLDVLLGLAGADGPSPGGGRLGDELILCGRALREGLILDYLERNLERVNRREKVPDLRRRSILELLSRSVPDERILRHHQHVARLALAIFDQTRPLHGLGFDERKLLEFAALIHDVGGQISFERHERHSYYLVKNADLRGFTPEEIDLLALVARYHRGASPKKRHKELGALDRRERRIVRRLAALLRIADALDRSHFQSVRGVKVAIGRTHVAIAVEAADDAELEVFTARRKCRLFERTFKRAVEITVLARRKAMARGGDDGDPPGQA